MRVRQQREEEWKVELRFDRNVVVSGHAAAHENQGAITSHLAQLPHLLRSQ
jgi:hypothetical protein